MGQLFILFYRMIKPNTIQFDHLQFINPSPFLTQPYLNDSTIVNIHSKQEIKIHNAGLAFTNICFKPNQSAKIQPQLGKRIHGRQTIKKLGQAKLLLQKQRKKQKIQNTSKELFFKAVRQKIEMSNKKILKSKNKSYRSSVQEIGLLQLDSALKSLEDNKKLKKRTAKPNFGRLSIELSSARFNQNKTHISCSVLELQGKSIENINKKIQVCQQKQKEQTGFYKKLKNKIQRAMNKLDQNNSYKQNLLVQGCKVYQHTNKSIISHQRSATDRLTLRNSLSRTGLQFKDYRYTQREKRPKTARASTSQRKQIEYLSSRSNQIFNQENKTKRSTKSSKQKIKEFCIPSTPQTLKHVSPISKQAKYAFSKGQVKKEKMKEKMLNILVECENQTEQSQNLLAGLTVFESFANRMNLGLENMSKRLQSNRPNHQYTQF